LSIRKSYIPFWCAHFRTELHVSFNLPLVMTLSMSLTMIASHLLQIWASFSPFVAPAHFAALFMNAKNEAWTTPNPNFKNCPALLWHTAFAGIRSIIKLHISQLLWNEVGGALFLWTEHQGYAGDDECSLLLTGQLNACATLCSGLRIFISRTIFSLGLMRTNWA